MEEPRQTIEDDKQPATPYFTKSKKRGSVHKRPFQSHRRPHQTILQIGQVVQAIQNESWRETTHSNQNISNKQHGSHARYSITTLNQLPITTALLLILLYQYLYHPCGGYGIPHNQQNHCIGHGQMGHLPSILFLLFQPYQYTKINSHVEFLIMVLTEMHMSKPSPLWQQ